MPKRNIVSLNVVDNANESILQQGGTPFGQTGVSSGEIAGLNHSGLKTGIGK